MEVLLYILAIPLLFVAYFLLKGIFQGATYYEIDPQNVHDIQAISRVAQVQMVIEKFDCSYEQLTNLLAKDKQWISRDNFNLIKSMSNLSDDLNQLSLSWEEWYEYFKAESAKLNPQLAVNEDGLSVVDLMDDEPLRNAHRDGQNPLVIAKEFAESFNILDFEK